VIVEGDERLLSYAASKASSDPEKRVAVEVESGGLSVTVKKSARGRYLAYGAISLLAILAAAGTTYFGYFVYRSYFTDRFVSHFINDGRGNLVQTLVWPAVLLAAIIALFLIAWRAIGGGHNVEISWKVTEKITGRVVITKVQTARRAPRRRAA
jgi:hypothetical protein